MVWKKLFWEVKGSVAWIGAYRFFFWGVCDGLLLVRSDVCGSRAGRALLRRLG